MKKTLALILAVVLLFSVFPTAVLADDSLERELGIVNGWIESDPNLSWFSESDIDIVNIPDFYKELFDVSFDEGVLNVTCKGNSNNAEAWQEAYLRGDSTDKVFFIAKLNKDSIFKEAQYIATFNGNDEDSFPMFRDNDEKKFYVVDGINNQIYMETAQVSSANSDVLTILPFEMEEFSYVIYGMKTSNESTDVTYKILLLHYQMGKTAGKCEIKDRYLQNGNRIHIETNTDAQHYKNLILDYDETTGMGLIKYVGPLTDTDSIAKEIESGNESSDENVVSAIDVRVDPPSDDYVYINRKNLQSNDFGTMAQLMVNGVFCKTPETISITWSLKSDTSVTFTEKFRIKVDIKSNSNKTWMDFIASPTDVDRIIFGYDQGPETFFTIKAENETNINDTGLTIKNDQPGLLHLVYDNTRKVTVYELNNLSAYILPPKDANYYVENECGGGDWADPDKRFADDQDGMLRNMEKEPVTDTQYMKGIDVGQFDFIEVDGVTTWYSRHKEGNQVLVIYWYENENDNEPIKKDYIYTYAEDYLWTVTTPTYTNTDALNGAVENPVVIGENLGDDDQQTEIIYYPQQSEENNFYFKIEEDGWDTENDSSTTGYAVVVPYWFLGYEDMDEAMEYESEAVVDHLTDGNTISETDIECEYTESGIVFKTSSFSPFVIKEINRKEKEEPDPIVPERKSRDTVVITIGKTTEEVPSDEANPNTGAEKFTGAVVAAAALSFVGVFFGKKR